MDELERRERGKKEAMEGDPFSQLESSPEFVKKNHRFVQKDLRDEGRPPTRPR